jgi:flagellar motor switch protein FliM
MSELLSQDEVNALLQSVPTLEPSSGAAASRVEHQPAVPAFAPQARAASPSAGSSQYRKRATRYDFRRPNRISKNVLQSLHFLHERYARNFGLSVSAYLRTICEIVLLSVDQLSYGEFLMSLPETTCINVVGIKPQGGRLAFEINPTLVFSVIEKLMGGNSETPSQNREITVLEQNLVEGYIEMALADLREVWQTIGETEFHLDRRETSPQLVQIVAPNEIVVVIVFEVKIGNTSGMMNFCIPAIYLEPFAVELRQESRTDIAERMTVEDLQRLDDVLASSHVRVSADLSQKRIPIRELLRLNIGDVIPINTTASDPVLVSVAGVPKFNAAFGARKGKKAVRIIDQISSDSEDSSADADLFQPVSVTGS